MKIEMIIMGYEVIDFTNDDGERVHILKVHALTDEMEGKDRAGFKVAHYNLMNPDTSVLMETNKQYPAIVDAEMSLQSNGKGQPQIRLKRFTYKKPMESFMSSSK